MPAIKRSAIGRRTRMACANQAWRARINRTLDQSRVEQTQRAATNSVFDLQEEQRNLTRHVDAEISSNIEPMIVDDSSPDYADDISSHIEPMNVDDIAIDGAPEISLNGTIDHERLAFRNDSNIDYAAQMKIGTMNIKCHHCKALKFRNEAAGLCCASGKVKLTPLVPPPEPLLSFVSGVGAASTHFLSNIQKYNNCFQMTSFGASKIVYDTFMPTFKVHTYTCNMYTTCRKF